MAKTSKGFKEYFFEFIMTFLAVTLGFFADDLKTHIQNESIIKADIILLVKDLESDSTMYNIKFVKLNNTSHNIDSLIKLLQSNDLSSEKIQTIYFLARNITANNPNYTPHTKTFNQINNSGNLSLIKNTDVLSSIESYYEGIEFLENQTNYQKQKTEDVQAANELLFYGGVFQEMYRTIKTGKYYNSIKKPKLGVQMLKTNTLQLNKILMRYHYLYSAIAYLDEQAKRQETGAIDLIKKLKKEYNLK